MTDSTDPTLPPAPTTPRSLLTKLLSWSETHTAVAVPIAAFVAGWLIGKML